MKIQHHDLVVPLDDSWWEEAGMKGFTPSASSYTVDNSLVQKDQQVYAIAITDVEPARRLPGIPVFNKSDFEGISAKERVVRILQGFVSGVAIPPVKLVRNTAGPHRYRVTDGTHRLYCSFSNPLTAGM